MKQKLHIFMTLLLLLVCGGASFGQTSAVTDELTPTSFGLKSGSYQDFTATYSSGAKYMGHFYGGVTTKLQMNSSKNKGIVTTVSAGTVKSIKIEFDSSNKNVVNVYGKNTAYSSTGDISSSTTQGTLIQKVNNSTTAVTITPSTKYQYVAFASNNGALYISKITIEWEVASSGKTPTTLSFGTDYDGKTITKNVGDYFEAPATLTPAVKGATITYKSSDETVAEITDGLVEAKKEGTTTITASYAGDDTYAASSASYTIIVNKAVADGVFDFSQPENYGYKKLTKGGTTMAAGTEVKAGNVTLTVLKKGTNDASWWSDGAWRIYKNSEHKLSVPEGYLITSVTIVPEGKYAYYKIQGGAVGKDWTGASQEVSIVNDAANNSRIKSITVKYTKLATLTTAASGFATYAADYDVNYSDAGLTAYAITLDEAAKTVKYTEATGVVPAGKAVLVKGEAQTEYTLTPATEDAADFTTDLQASDGKVTSENGLYYVFATINGKSGFKILADGTTIPAKKGYLKLSTASAKSFFEMEGGEATGISEIEAEAANDNAAIYNLAGQRVSKGYKGIAIKNGKKFVK